MTAIAGCKRFLWVLCFFVCPLIFFTNLTRNPYQTQICLLNISLALLAVATMIESAQEGQALRLPLTPLDAALLAWLVACALSWVVAYFGHLPFFRPSIRMEGGQKWIFLVLNTIIPYYLGAQLSAAGDDKSRASPGAWGLFALIWGLSWLAFPMFRGPNAGAVRLWAHVWDGYGALLWLGGILWGFWLCRQSRAADYWHLALVSGVLASAYGVCQYFGKDFIWPMTLNPYGGRSVSTFGNPNFLSSYNVVLLPAAAVFFLNSRGRLERFIYAAAFLILEANLVCSMTRSSWGAGIFALAILSFSAELRKKFLEEPRLNGLLLALALALIILWPQNRSPGYGSGVLGRFTEIVTINRLQGGYAPFHQRVLIWLCAWMMGAENPLTGKGWGLLELFYPFYQGFILNNFDFFVSMRTHANNAHNEILEIFSQTGILGLGVFAWVWVVFFTVARRHFQWWGRSGAALAAVCGVAGMLADNMMNVSLHFAVPAFLFWWAAGISMGGLGPSLWRIPRLAPSLSIFLSAALAAIFLGSSWIWCRTWLRETHYFAGFKLLRQPALPEALKELELARYWGPREVNAIYELGNAYARSERFPEALGAYLLALKANAGYDEIYFNMGTLLSSKLGDSAQAEKYLRTAWWINPLSSDIYVGLGSLYLRDPMRYHEQARQLLERAVHFYPDTPHHWSNLGYVYNLEGETTKAEEAYVRALSLEPDMAVAEQNLRASLSRSRHPRPAILGLLESLRQAEARVAVKDYSTAALALAEMAASGLPQSPRARFLYGSLLLAQNRTEQALPHLEWVVGRYPQHVTARLNLSGAYLRLRQADKALEQLRAILAIDPGNLQAKQQFEALQGASAR